MSLSPGVATDHRVGWLAISIAALVVGVTTIVAMQTNVAGQFHDDAIYMTTAQSLAQGDGYRHASLPGNPVQTKYPPLHSAILAAVWKIAPDFPENIPWFKLTSVLFLVLIVFAAGVFGSQRIGGRVAPPVFALLVGVSPLVFPFADYALTELPFLLLCLIAFCMGPQTDDGGRPVGSAGGLGRAAALGCVCGLAMLFRQAALPLILTAMICYALRRDWRALGAFAAATAVFFVPWLWFKAAFGVPEPNVLLAYYTTYEPSVLQLGLADPALAWRIIVGNLYYLWGTFDLAAYLYYFPLARILVYPVFLLGLWRVFRRPLDFITIFAVLYGGLIVLWPWHPARYALPLAPFVPLALFLAGRWMAERMRQGEARTTTLDRLTRRILPWPPVAVLVAMALGWLASYVPLHEDTTRAAFYVRLEYRWEDFEQTARWIEENTAPDAILASAYDPLYYLYTGRRGIRPWEHRPWTYFYPVGAQQPYLGEASDIQAALDDVGANYFVIDPLEGYVEAQAVRHLYADVLSRYAGPAYDGMPTLRFVSSDGLHRIYELPDRIDPDVEDP